jgi:hypothetical protein
VRQLNRHGILIDQSAVYQPRLIDAPIELAQVLKGA